MGWLWWFFKKFDMYASYKTVDVDVQYGGTAILRELAAFTSYDVVVQAFNSKGSGNLSDPVVAKTMESSRYHWRMGFT